ncbi:uncharacterized protein TNCV_4909581 [Trichonephila clavipes]|uniref:DUF5641 domain-containing protein n=1 Tax=Trichonephila clavipes TaxID=2585209 RepID=A0A8X6RPR6_TRICX|nr:uncharacterized protein TNCV_4909581 [Trichonephila clavipes]
MSEFEAGISYQNKRYKVKFPWKPNMKTLLENNEEIARERFLRLRSRFKNDSSLFEDYKLVVNNYLSEKIIEHVPFEEENLKHNIFYLPHRAVIRTDKTTSKLRIVFDAASHAKSQLSLNDCLHTGLNFIPNLFFLLIKFRVNPIAFVADIKMAFLMIEIDESERDFTRFFWDENPGIDLENKRLDIFRMTRVLFEVKSSPFLLAATIKHHLKKYVDIFPDTLNNLNQSLYVDDFLCGNVSVQAALTTCIESKQILEDAIDEHKESLNTLIASKVLGVGWNEKSNTFYFDSSDLGTFLSKRINTKGYLLQAAGRLFDPGGRLKHSTLSEFQKHQMMLPKATNFKGARNILNEWNEICTHKSNRIQLFSEEEEIEWNFIPPASPHFGGLWEANIKSMKRMLLRVAKSAIMNFEELTSLMAQIEAVLNSRPLSSLSSDPNDLNSLTPEHFLTNCAISSFPEPYTASDSLSYHSRWKLIQSLRDKFWNRWSTEYLIHLQTRAKWSEQNPNQMENQLVLLKDPNTKPLDWPMGRILEVFPGSDGLVRVVNVKTSTGILKRAITKVVPLPIPVDPATVEKNN